MPIHDLSYRPYNGPLADHSWRWLTIAKSGLQGYFSRKLFLIFIFLAYINPIVRGVFVWLSHQGSGTDPFFQIDGQFFRQLLFVQGWFLLLTCIWPGATLISRDLHTNAIQLYLARPLSRIDYVLGKFAIVAGIGSLLLPLPALLLFLMELGLSTDSRFLTQFYWIPFAVLGYSAVVMAGAGILCLAASSVTRSSRYAGLLFFALIFFSGAGSALIRLITGEHFWVVLSLASLVDQVGALFFGGPTEYGTHPLAALLMYAMVCGLSLVVLRRRVQAVEIIS